MVWLGSPDRGANHKTSINKLFWKMRVMYNVNKYKHVVVTCKVYWTRQIQAISSRLI